MKKAGSIRRTRHRSTNVRRILSGTNDMSSPSNRLSRPNRNDEQSGPSRRTRISAQKSCHDNGVEKEQLFFSVGIEVEGKKLPVHKPHKPRKEGDESADIKEGHVVSQEGKVSRSSMFSLSLCGDILIESFSHSTTPSMCMPSVSLPSVDRVCKYVLFAD